MRYASRVAGLAAASLLVQPQFAFAANNSPIVPNWLSLASAGVGLVIAIIVLVDAVLLRRVSEGSMIADNIVYMMLAVVCLAASMLARWFGALMSDADLSALITFAGDLLVTAGLGLLALYFIRLRTAMNRYLEGVRAYAAAASAPAPTSDPESGEPRG